MDLYTLQTKCKHMQTGVLEIILTPIIMLIIIFFVKMFYDVMKVGKC
jgi:hypothetical protein